MGTTHKATTLEQEHATHHGHAHDHDEHHETFVSKYVFSQDHKLAFPGII